MVHCQCQHRCRCRCRTQHFQTISPLKPLSQLKSNSLTLCGVGEQKFVHNVRVTWPRWPPYPYMVKTFENLLRRNRMAWYAAFGTLLYEVCTNDDPWLALINVTARSNSATWAFVWGKRQTVYVSEALVAYDIKVDICSQLNDFFIYIKGQGHL